MKKAMLILIGIILMGFVLASSPPEVSNVYNSPENPCIEEDVTICAQVSDEFRINSVRLNLYWIAHHEDIFMYKEGDEYCRTISPDYFDAFIGQEISYYIFTSNDFGTHQTSWYYFTYQEEAIAFCGDGICNGDENCSTCPQDCGECEPIPQEDQNETNQTHSKSSHKNHFVQFCDVNWKCSGWGECVNSLMTRKCYDKNHCRYSYNKPIEKTGCDMLSKVLVKEDKLNSVFILFGIITTLILIVVLVGLLSKR